MRVVANGIALEVEDSGADGSQSGWPAVLLLMGLGMQLTAWPPAFVRALVSAGFRVVRLDNRDIGLSQDFDHLGRPNLMWQSVKRRLGLRVHAPYSLRDMAQDALGVLDVLGIGRAHVVGVSMGGMIAQRVALAAPVRVLSLTSIMSSSGALDLPGPRADVLRALLTRPADRSEEAAIENTVRFFRLIGSPAFPLDDQTLRDAVRASMKRSFHPAGTLRQMVAVIADLTRAEELARVRTPTLVVHGRDDPLVPYACGVDTARRIAGARLVGVTGMGHDMPPGVIEHILGPLLPHLESARSAA
ncbi:alpha/beta fold hydrolase [Caenimonas terrae]|uniref:Alpha/beta fold hydrolase n=1 Tax=Caenimonas terrae TaxID=696074 RepID=A0ABW0NDI9_9BURK